MSSTGTLMRKMARRITEHSDSAYKEMRGKFRPGRIQVRISAVEEAIKDSQLDTLTAYLVAVAYDSAHGGGEACCLTCERPWTRDQQPVVVVRVDLLGQGHLMGGCVCRKCAGNNIVDARDRVQAAINKWLGPTNGWTDIPSEPVGSA